MPLLIGLIGFLLTGAGAAVQPPQADQAAAVRIVVLDQSGLPIQGAEVTLIAGDNKLAAVGRTDDRGTVRFDNVTSGDYSGRVASAGFRPSTVEALSVRSGDRATRTVTLQIAGVLEQVEVTPSDDSLKGDPFSRRLTLEELAALPEDPVDLGRMLAALAGDDADIRVDGFKGGRLPLGTQIREVHIRQHVGAAARTGGPRVEIRTTPGGDRWRSNAIATLQDAALGARDALSGRKPTGQTRQYSWSLTGPVVREHTGLSVTLDGSQSIDHQSVHAATPGGIFSTLVSQPSTALGLWANLDHRISSEQAVRVEFRQRTDRARNQGIGQFDLPERSFSTTSHGGEFRLAHHATTGRGYVNDLRFGLDWDRSDASSLVDARTMSVLDAFTSGGAQLRGGERSRRVTVENELEFDVGSRHSVSTGVSIDGGDYQGDEYTNSAGTYTFASLAAFEAGQPQTFTQRVGNATYRYSLYRFGWYVQDDFRATRSLLINLGVRHDFQTHMRDWANVSPRLGINWTPSAAARTVLRASIGQSYSQLDPLTYRQLLLMNGFAQRDIVISNPGYPDPFSAGVTESALPPSIVRARGDLELPFAWQYSFGVDQPMGRFVKLRGTFSRQTGHRLFRSRNANAPVGGVRPDPSVLNVTQLESTGRSVHQSIQTDVTVNYLPKRLSANASYVFGEALNDADGPFSLPPSSVDLTREWGPSSSDARHRLNIGLNSELVGGLRVAAFFQLQSALPYTVILGTDPNGDGIANERPAQVGRNSARGASSKNLDLMLTWRLGFGRGQQQAGSPGQGRRGAASNEAPFRIELFARASNVMNLVNRQGFSGVLTSPFFGQPTSAGTPRRIVIGSRVWF